jgi:hypothetical protein
LRLLEYWRREAEAKRKAVKAAKQGREYVPEEAWHEPDEKEAEMQMAMMPRAGSMPGQVGVEPNVTRIPEDLRDLIRWAEEAKTKRVN